jgi:hypothetical protein
MIRLHTRSISLTNQKSEGHARIVSDKKIRMLACKDFIEALKEELGHTPTLQLGKSVSMIRSVHPAWMFDGCLN